MVCSPRSSRRAISSWSRPLSIERLPRRNSSRRSTISHSGSGWEATTIKTLVTRLVKKGELRQTKRGVYYYSPAISREEYGSGEARRLAEKVYGGGLAKLVASFVEGGEFSKSELDELRELLNNADGGGKDA